MVIPPLFYWLPRRNVNSTFVLLNMVIPPFIYWLQEEMVYLWFIDCQEEMWIPHPDIRNGNSTSKHVQLYQTISIMYKLFYSIRKLTLLFSIQFSCVSFNACNSFGRCLFYILYNDMIVQWPLVDYFRYVFFHVLFIYIISLFQIIKLFCGVCVAHFFI